MQSIKRCKNTRSAWIAVMVVSFIITAATMNAAAKEVTYEGTIQGLNCTYYGKECPKDDLDTYVASGRLCKSKRIVKAGFSHNPGNR